MSKSKSKLGRQTEARETLSQMLSDIEQSDSYLFVSVHGVSGDRNSKNMNMITNVDDLAELVSLLRLALRSVRMESGADEHESRWEDVEGLTVEQLQARRDEASNFVLHCDRTLRRLRAKSSDSLH